MGVSTEVKYTQIARGRILNYVDVEGIAVNRTDSPVRERLQTFLSSMQKSGSTESIDITAIYLVQEKRLRSIAPRMNLMGSFLSLIPTAAYNVGLNADEINRQFANTPTPVFREVSTSKTSDIIKKIFPQMKNQNSTTLESVMQFYCSYIISISSISSLLQMIEGSLSAIENGVRITETTFISVAEKFSNEMSGHPVEWLFQIEMME